MILVDFSLISIMCLTSWYKRHPNNSLTVNEGARIITENLADYKMRFQNHGKMVLACDSRSYWRKDVFPHYKFKRKQNREKSAENTNVDWTVIHGAMDMVKNYLDWYKVIEVDGAEADDVIAVLTKQFAKNENIVILSSDKDFVQLQTHSNVVQYNPSLARYVSYPDPVAHTREHIIRGDSGDSIPNFLSPDDTIVLGQRNKIINTPKLQEWVQRDDYLTFCDTPAKKANYERNRQLIDFDYIPPKIKDAILTEYHRN